MSITVTTDVHCDRCPQWTSGVSGRLVARATEARKVAAGQGWTRRRDNDGELVDLCPACSGREVPDA